MQCPEVPQEAKRVEVNVAFTFHTQCRALIWYLLMLLNVFFLFKREFFLELLLFCRESGLKQTLYK